VPSASVVVLIDAPSLSVQPSPVTAFMLSPGTTVYQLLSPKGRSDWVREGVLHPDVSVTEVVLASAGDATHQIGVRGGLV
jgi:hypothetical protein